MALFKKERLLELRREAETVKKHRVLVVDDELENLKTLKSLLEQKYEVLLAKDGREALDMITARPESEPIQLVISDQRMPNLSGTELFERMLPIAPKTMRILLTGYTDINAITDSINKAHIYQFVFKPFDREELLLTVARALESYDMQAQLDDYHQNLERKVRDRTQQLQEKNRELEHKNEELKEAYRKLEALSVADPLTGLYNRRYFLQWIEKSEAFIMRTHQHDDQSKPRYLCFLLLDLDHFKAVNDTHGHAAGDKVLMQLADVLRETCREADILIRWGGEEFLIASYVDEPENGFELAERIRCNMAATQFGIGDGKTLEKTCSLGFACHPFLGDDLDAFSWEMVVDLADLCLYAAKKTCRNASVGVMAGEGLKPGNLSARMHEDANGLVASGEIKILTSIPEETRLIWP